MHALQLAQKANIGQTMQNSLEKLTASHGMVRSSWGPSDLKEGVMDGVGHHSLRTCTIRGREY